MKAKTLGFAAVSLLLLGIFLLGSTTSPFASSSRHSSSHSTRRTLIGKQEEAVVELVDGQDFVQEDSEEDRESFYKPWIEQDFSVWGKDGIKQVRHAQSYLGALASASIAATPWRDSISEAGVLSAELGG